MFSHFVWSGIVLAVWWRFWSYEREEEEEEEEREMECDIVQIICHFGVILVCRLVVGRRRKKEEEKDPTKCNPPSLYQEIVL